MPTPQSNVLAVEPADPVQAAAHFSARLEFETDPSDLFADLDAGIPGIVVVDGRHPDSYAKEHIPGAVNLWHRRIDEKSVAELDRNTVYVTYCTGVGCNASTKAALKLSQLGFKVKELIGGLQWWKSEGYPVEGEG